MTEETTTDKKTINATVRISPEDWESLREKASQLGMNRTQFFIQIARGEIKLDHGLLIQEKQLLGESIVG
ncbi:MULTISPECIES: plasmid mobilization protein [unclassified Nostoc]|uniref:plasmid mobilization protein n=1 Tax=unclassified Nostoc TaxID=2593658 RepID=UPI003919D60B